jgi:hypothetical protein
VYRGTSLPATHGLPSFPRTTPLGNFFGGAEPPPVAVALTVSLSRLWSAIALQEYVQLIEESG